MTKSREPTLREIRKLVAFLPELHAEGFTPIERWDTRNGDGTPCFPWPEYDELVERFFAAAASECWLDQDHVPEEAGAMLQDEKIVKAAALSRIRTMMTYCLRGERFCDGHWGAMIRDGYVRRLLERLEVIASEMSEERLPSSQ